MTIVISFFLRWIIPGCLTAIPYDEKDHGLSSAAKPAYTSAFGTHCGDNVGHQFENGSALLEIRPLCCSLAIISRQTDELEWDVWGSMSTLINQGPFWIIQYISTPRKWREGKNKDKGGEMATREETKWNKDKRVERGQRWEIARRSGAGR